MQTNFEDGFYWTHSKYGPSIRAAWRMIQIKNGLVRVVKPKNSEYEFNQTSFFDVNTMVAKVN